MREYVVYCASLGDSVLYVGSGAKGRERHCTSGRSNCLELNEHYFKKDAVVVKILEFLDNKQQSLILEEHYIRELNPLYNRKAACNFRFGVTYIGNDYPYEKVLLDLTANESRLYKLILDAYDYKTGYSVVDISQETQSTKTELSKGYKGLLSKALVKRVRQKVYLINPCAKIHLELFDELYDVWNKIDG
jgi:hypothetical protein